MNDNEVMATLEEIRNLRMEPEMARRTADRCTEMLVILAILEKMADRPEGITKTMEAAEMEKEHVEGVREILAKVKSNKKKYLFPLLYGRRSV
jgi:hypothetical protein